MLTKMNVTKTEWAIWAKFFARDANENHFSSRRGVWFVDNTRPFLVIFNNNPYRIEPLSKQTRRDEETATFRQWLKKEGIKELAYATYPETGEEAGYTYAMLLDAGKDRQADVMDAMMAILVESWSRPKSAADETK